MKENNLTRRIDYALAAPMFAASLVVLWLLAALLYWRGGTGIEGIQTWCIAGLAIMYPLFWLEAAIHWFAGSRFLKQHIWFCVLPITRIGCRDHETGQEIWLPIVNWREVNRPLERGLARRFSIPMIAIALMVLPIIVLEFFCRDFVDSNAGWKGAMKISEAFIWAAFTFEFTLMISIARYPVSYAKKQWIDLAIILLPMLAFARTLRLASLGRLNQLSRTARVFRLRGLGMRMWRGFVALEIVEMFLSRNPERRLEKLEMQLEDRVEEIGLLRKDIRRLKKRVKQRKAAAEKKRVDNPEPESDGLTDTAREDDGQDRRSA